MSAADRPLRPSARGAVPPVLPAPLLAALLSTLLAALPVAAAAQARYFEVAADAGAHDVAPDPRPGGPVYFTEQRKGRLGILRPADGHIDEIDLGPASAPHGVIIGPDGAAWITDGGQNAIVRFDPATKALRSWGLPADARAANLNTAAFDAAGRLWFTGQSGYYGRLDADSGRMQVWKAPRGTGPYGITATPKGEVWFASLAGNYIARIDTDSGEATVIAPPTPKQGARRLASDSAGRLWVSYWNTGQLGMYDPATGAWREWKLPGSAHAYGICVDAADRVWLSDWGSNAIVRFDPGGGTFTAFASDRPGAQVRQLAARAGEVWGAESGRDRLLMLPAH